MKALIVSKKYTLGLQEIAMPIPGPFQALVKILACGICSTTDAELIKGTQPYHTDYPCLLGHEAIGEVVETGNRVTGFKAGDWVTRPAGILPGIVQNGVSSAWGGFAGYGLVTDIQAMSAAGDTSMNNDYTALRQNVLEGGKEIGIEASVLSIALAETLSWSNELNLSGKTVCINGTGIAGLSLVLWAKMAKAKQVIVLGRRDERLQLSVELGADDTINTRKQSPVEAIRKLNEEGVDFFLEATGAPDQVEVAVRSVKKGGVVGVYGVAPHNHYALKWEWLPVDIRITRHEPMEHKARQEVVGLIMKGCIPVDKLMTHKWPLADFSTAFRTVAAGEVVKSMLMT